MRLLIILLFLGGCAKPQPKPQYQEPQRPPQQPQCEYISFSNQFMFCNGSICCDGYFNYPYATCTFR